MVLISSVKYACETCIKGHRSSTCKHTDRPLFEIKKKGRPVTQCEHCRELRRTKQVHVKCVCQAKAPLPTPDGLHGNKKGIYKTLECAAFPNGLPESVEASVAMQLSSEGSSDSDHAASCTCNSGSDCHCCTPRKTTRRSRRKEKESFNNQSPSPPPPLEQAPAHIRARVAELRPVLPRPPIFVLDEGPMHNPSGGHHSRYHGHEHYNPYNRAYDYNNTSLTRYATVPNVPSVDLPWSNGTPDTLPSGATCGCGDECRCPGCSQHNGPDSFSPSAAFSSCMNPGACGACLNCSLLAFQTSLSDNTYDLQGFDDWTRQLSPNTVANPIEPQPQDCGLVCDCPSGFCRCPTFTVSGDRTSCSGFDPMPQMTIPANSFLTVPQTYRSRSSSTSSDSSGFSATQLAAPNCHPSSNTSASFSLDRAANLWSA